VNNDGFILRKIMAELITENELETKVRSFKDTSTDKIIVSASQRDDGWWVLSISHNQILENIEHKYLYKIKIRDENKEKGYKSLDILAKRLKEIGIEVFAIVLSDNKN
jgi:hypothetical protein